MCSLDMTGPSPPDLRRARIGKWARTLVRMGAGLVTPHSQSRTSGQGWLLATGDAEIRALQQVGLGGAPVSGCGPQPLVQAAPRPPSFKTEHMAGLTGQRAGKTGEE